MFRSYSWTDSGSLIGSAPTSGFRGRTSSLLDCAFKFLTGMERYHAARLNGNDFTGFGVAARPGGLVAHLEISETGQLDFRPPRQRFADFLEKGFNDVLGLTLVQPHSLEQQFSQFSLGQCALYSHGQHSFYLA